MQEITFIIDEIGGEIVVEDNPGLSKQALEFLEESLGEPSEIACARPLLKIKPPIISLTEYDDLTVRINGYYHNSLTEGPGRRSAVLFQSCPLKCQGCYVPELHDRDSGNIISVKKLAELLLDPKFVRDGVTILGGEPFAQPEGLYGFIKELRQRGCRHIICYSGYTLETLCEKAINQPQIKEILDEIDILIDGPFIEPLANQAGLWTGSGNQRVIDLKATRMNGQVVLHRNN